MTYCGRRSRFTASFAITITICRPTSAANGFAACKMILPITCPFPSPSRALLGDLLSTMTDFRAKRNP